MFNQLLHPDQKKVFSVPRLLNYSSFFSKTMGNGRHYIIDRYGDVVAINPGSQDGKALSVVIDGENYFRHTKDFNYSSRREHRQ